MKKPASKVAEPAQIQPKSQFLFHKNLPPLDFSLMTLIISIHKGTNKKQKHTTKRTILKEPRKTKINKDAHYNNNTNLGARSSVLKIFQDRDLCNFWFEFWDKWLPQKVDFETSEPSWHQISMHAHVAPSSGFSDSQRRENKQNSYYILGQEAGERN